MSRVFCRATLVLLTVVLSATTAWAESAFGGGDGSEKNPYVINNSEDWDQLVSFVNDGVEGYATAYYQLNNDISVKTMVGTDEHRFQGHFDGNKKKLNFDIYIREDYAAPFRYVDGAEISNLHVGGTITTAGMYAAGLVANTVGETSIVNCRISITITCRRYNVVSHAGVVARNTGGSLFIEGCVFDGVMIGRGTTYWAGFVGWNERKDDANGTVTISRCLFVPTKTETYITKTFVRSHSYDDGIIKLTDCYCSTSYGNEQDTRYYKLFNDDGVRVEYNCGDEARVCSVSGLTFYNTGFTYDDQICARSGSNLSLNVTLDENPMRQRAKPSLVSIPRKAGLSKVIMGLTNTSSRWALTMPSFLPTSSMKTINGQVMDSVHRSTPISSTPLSVGMNSSRVSTPVRVTTPPPTIS